VVSARSLTSLLFWRRSDLPAPKRFTSCCKLTFFRSHTGTGPGWSDWGDSGYCLYAVQDCWQRLLWRGLSDQAVAERRGCRHQKSVARQALQGTAGNIADVQMLTGFQNRELQIMRIVRHPNIVELKAFYYSNGERVCMLHKLESS
jgi:hypothetical protein